MNARWEYREECPWCADTFYSEGAFKAHAQAELAISKSCASIRTNEAGGGLEEAKKGRVQQDLPLMASCPDDLDVFGNWK